MQSLPYLVVWQAHVSQIWFLVTENRIYRLEVNCGVLKPNTVKPVIYDHPLVPVILVVNDRWS